MTKKTEYNFRDINADLLKEASDKLLMLSESYMENKHLMYSMELLKYVEDFSQDIVYNLTQTIRNLTDELDDE